MIEDLLSRLDKVRSRSGDRYTARCPSHDDKTPSLSLCQLSDGRVLIHCFAGCSPLDILNSVGMEMADLFPDRGLGQFRGFEMLKRDIEYSKNLKIEKKNELENIVLAIASNMRAKGEKLSREDLEREKQAYIEVHKNELNHG